MSFDGYEVITIEISQGLERLFFWRLANSDLEL